MLTTLKALFHAGKNILKKVLKSFRLVRICYSPVFKPLPEDYIIGLLFGCLLLTA
jgi:hypothetical protein